MRKEASAASALSAVAASAAESPSALTAPSDATVETGSTSQEHDKSQPKQAHVRGKSGQRKKMKEKYRDQGLENSNVVCNFILNPCDLADDDERELALEVNCGMFQRK